MPSVSFLSEIAHRYWQNPVFSVKNGGRFYLPTLFSAKTVGVFASRRCFLRKRWAFLSPDAVFCEKRWAFLLPDAVFCPSGLSPVQDRRVTWTTWALLLRNTLRQSGISWFGIRSRLLSHSMHLKVHYDMGLKRNNILSLQQTSTFLVRQMMHTFPMAEGRNNFRILPQLAGCSRRANDGKTLRLSDSRW